jgi:Ca2+-binding EF-hand superfamily protein
MYSAVMSLMFSVTGGADWGDLAEPFCRINRIHCTVYASWVIIVTFGLVNITVGIFVRQAEEFHLWDRKLIVEGALQDHENAQAVLEDLFDRMDVDNTGEISIDDVKKCLRDTHVLAYFAQMEIDVDSNPEEFFRVLDTNSDNTVSREEFARVCMALKGGAKPLDVKRIFNHLGQVQQQVNQIADMAHHNRELAMENRRMIDSSHGGGSPRTVSPWLPTSQTSQHQTHQWMPPSRV